jgi:predicted N-acetyltransferase YhbS
MTVSATAFAPFSIRLARLADLPYIRLICEDVGLGIVDTTTDVLVAVGEEDLPVGFIRIEVVCGDKNPQANGNYVYPVAVLADWQRHGVAQALVERAGESYGQLKLVACTESQGFYPKAGFAEMPMAEVAASIAHDCECCKRLGTECFPKAFIRGPEMEDES